MPEFLPVSLEELKRQKGTDQFDFICITGDAYVDHPSFGIAIISRIIEAQGFHVGVIAQPEYKSIDAFKKLGKPKYGFMVTSGNIDSMVSNYTVAKKLRTDDAYSAGGTGGKRPDRALTIYCNRCRQAYPDVPIVVGGLEASLRRFAHYDYWDDDVKMSVLCDSKADLLIYGMGEKQIIEIVNRLSSGEDIKTVTDIKGTCYLTEPKNTPLGAVQCPDYDMVSKDKKSYTKACRQQLDEQDEVYGRMLIQRQRDKMLVQNPPMPVLSKQEFDAVYDLPFARMYHPMYEKSGGVPAIEEVEFSIIHNRGCFGNCNFCSIALHQGRKISSRSEESIISEAQDLVSNPRFKGYIHDVGGPTANFRNPSCDKQQEHGMCKGKKCLAPTPCKMLKVDHTEYRDLLRKIRKIKGIKKVFVRSGIRYDYLMEDKDQSFFKELVEHHVSGQLKVAPEHCSNSVLDNMGKPHIEAYEKFSKRFYEITKSIGKEQYLVPYLMSSHPGSTLKDAIQLALFLKKNKIRPEQVQDFYPTPGTISTCMFYTELNPYTMEHVYVPKTSEEKAMQRALLQYFKLSNQKMVIKALTMAKRTDLIGSKPECLVAHNESNLRNKTPNTSKYNQKKGDKKWQKEKRKSR
ncbi:MAG: Fe-S oxidoreductase [Oscillospiraceae bacterium]|nr:Fe-S oxidoreductase [Oscillospiraceae bacterium]